MVNDTDKKSAISYARAELEDIDRRLADLKAERVQVAGYLARLTGEATSRTSAGEAPQGVPTFSPSYEGEKPYHSRAYNKRAVEEAVQMIITAGKPMSAPEINKAHSQRAIIPTETLYRLLYNRVVAGTLMSLDGSFWPEGRELPPGYDLTTAKRSVKFAT